MTSFIAEVSSQFNLPADELKELWCVILRNNKKKAVKKPKEKVELPDINKYVDMLEKSLSMEEEEYISLRNKEHEETGVWYPHIKEEDEIFTFIFGTYGIEYMKELETHHSKVIKDHKDAYNTWMEEFFNPRFNAQVKSSSSKKSNKKTKKSA